MEGQKRGNILLIIPAYNEAENIERVIEELKVGYKEYDYLIINDGSKDKTEAICRENGYHYISMPVNVGLSGVFRTGMKYADKYGYEMAIQYDGDGQHNPYYIDDLINKMKSANSDIVIGSRWLTQKGSFSLRYMGSKLLKVLIKLTTGKWISDPTSGMRLYNRNMIHLFGNNINFPPEPDAIAYVIKQGYRVDEVQVEMRERQAGVSYLNLGNAIRYMLNMCISIVFIQWFRKEKKK